MKTINRLLTCVRAISRSTNRLCQYWVHAIAAFVVIISCVFTGSLLTSCSDDDNSDPPEYQKKLIGEWFATANRHIGLDDENDVVYMLLSFDEDGVLFQNS